jgi:hypothetical protein
MEHSDVSRLDQVLDKIARMGVLSPGEVSAGGPMGSGRWLFISDTLVMELYSDRGSVGVAVGRRGRDTYRAEVWADVLGVTAPGRSVDAQVDFSGRHLAAVDEFLQDAQDGDDVLRAVNWSHVRKALGLGPGAKVSDPSTWQTDP